MPVSVKLVAVDNIGTIAVGVAKAGADVIEIDGIDGGTGAAMVSSKEHAGLPSEMGLAEAHQALVVNGIRTRVKLRVGGGIKNGYDVVKYALFGADEFSFGQGLMVSVGCIVCKSCHIPNCPTGITGSPEIFKGHPEHTKAYLRAVAEETRGSLPRWACSTRRDRRPQRPAGPAHRPDRPGPRGSTSCASSSAPTWPCHGTRGELPGRDRTDRRLCVPTGADAQRADAVGGRTTPSTRARTPRLCSRSATRTVASARPSAGRIAKLYGREGMPNGKKIKVRFDGEAGQSFGAWCVNGLDLDCSGFAQDGVAKGITGGVVVTPRLRQAPTTAARSSRSPGTTSAYGATGGNVFIGGRAGHRLGIRNSGATIVAEAAGKYACEYMTRGRVLILGPIENEIGSGMTGGELFVFDPTNDVPAKLHSRSVAVVDCQYVDYEWIHPLIQKFYQRTQQPPGRVHSEELDRHPPGPPPAEDRAAGRRPGDGGLQDRRHERGVSRTVLSGGHGPQ